MAKKPKGRFLDRPLKVGGGIQPRLVTVLTPATTFTVRRILFKKCLRSIGPGQLASYFFERASVRNRTLAPSRSVSALFFQWAIKGECRHGPGGVRIIKTGLETGLCEYAYEISGGADGTRTRDLRRDRPAF